MYNTIFPKLQVWYNLLKRRGCSVVNLFPREVPRVLNLFPRELIESTPMDFPNANPKLHQRPDPARSVLGQESWHSKKPLIKSFFRTTSFV